MNQTNNEDVESRPKTNPIKISMSDIKKRVTRSADIHRATQRSTTLVRRVAKKPTPSRLANLSTPAKRRSMDIAKSSKISHFGEKTPTINSLTQNVATKPDRPAQTHPLTDRLK